MTTVRVSASKPYDVLIGRGLLLGAGELISNRIKPCLAAVITDDTVGPIYGGLISKSLEKSGFKTVRYEFPSGEESKNLSVFSDILEFLAVNGLTRSDLIVALGGGVVGDMAGYCAAAYQRGISFVQIPTTFLSAIDSSVGGKTAVNLKAGKNLAGAFWQPELVICDCDTLITLPHEIFTDGAAEAVKYGMIADRELFERLLSGNYELVKTVARCVEIKSQVVSEDEFDRGARQLLNFGHTVGHAIENCSGYKISHGRAVAIGMAVITRASDRLGLSEERCYPALKELLVKHGLPIECPFDIDTLLPVILSDKKRGGEHITIIIPSRIGQCRLHKIPVSQLKEIISAGIEKEDRI